MGKKRSVRSDILQHLSASIKHKRSKHQKQNKTVFKVSQILLHWVDSWVCTTKACQTEPKVSHCGHWYGSSLSITTFSLSSWRLGSSFSWTMSAVLHALPSQIREHWGIILIVKNSCLLYKGNITTNEQLNCFWKTKLSRTYTLWKSHSWGLVGRTYTDVVSLNKAHGSLSKQLP